LAQYWTTESKDISRCNRFAQMSKVPWTNWNARVHFEMQTHWCT
jgi:hypothetical protein